MDFGYFGFRKSLNSKLYTRFMRPQDTFCFTGKTVDWVFSQLQKPQRVGTQSQKGVRPDMLWPLSAIHVHTSAIGKTRPRSGPHGVCSAEHERCGGRPAPI